MIIRLNIQSKSSSCFYLGIENLCDENVVILEVFSLPEEFFLIILVANVSELGWRTAIYCRFHIYDVCNVPFIILVIPIGLLWLVFVNLAYWKSYEKSLGLSTSLPDYIKDILFL